PFQHGPHRPVGLRGILVSQHLAQDGGNDLPRQAILVLQPAALIFSPAGQQLLPQLVHFLLCLAVHEQRDRRCELELRAAIEGVKLLSLELESRGHHGSLRAGPCRSVARDVGHLRVLEDRHVEIHRLFGVAVEPQERDDLLHMPSLYWRRHWRLGYLLVDASSHRLSTLRCLETAGWLMANGLASSVTDACPAASRARIARRVGSARAAKVASRCFCCITCGLYTKGSRLSRDRQGISGDSPPTPRGVGGPRSGRFRHGLLRTQLRAGGPRLVRDLTLLTQRSHEALRLLRVGLERPGLRD